MEFLVNAADMKQCDLFTIRQVGIPSMVLMERAALAVTEELVARAPSLKSVLVVCGSGNNGGDGFAAARLLDERGIPVTLLFMGREEALTEEARLQKSICRRCGIEPETDFWGKDYSVIVDALFGIGLSRPVEGKYADLLNWMNHQDAYRVAVDIPSGISADTGAVLGTAFRADLTVTFAYRKLGHILYPGTEYCGTVVRRDIGITSDGLRQGKCPFLYEPEDLQRIPPRRPYSNKGTYGKVLLIAGSRGMSGAAYLAALAAYRTGCGLVRILTPACNREILQGSLPEAIVTTWESDEKDISGIFRKDSSDPSIRDGSLPDASGVNTSDRDCKLEECLQWADVVALGPGMGRNTDTREILSQVLRNWKHTLVIDADGLNELSRDPDLLLDTDASVILTPHVGEMSRLIGKEKEEITEDLLECAHIFAGDYQVVCVLKDARTVISDGTRLCINTSGNNGMAVGGSGDILTGIIASLAAQHMSSFEAASCGVYLHGLAGDEAQRRLGAYSLIATDIIQSVPQVLRTVFPG